jgi:hypothetical protein
MPDKDASHEMDDMIRESAQLEVPADVEAHLRQRLTEFRSSIERRPQNRLQVWAYSLVSWPTIRTAAATAIAVLAVIAGIMLIQSKSAGGRVYAAAVERLRSAQSLEYTIVLNEMPYVAVDFSYVSPGYKRINCSWGIEIRTHPGAGQKAILMHLTRLHFRGKGEPDEALAGVEDLAEQLRLLARESNQAIGKRSSDDKKFLGYRVRKSPASSSFPGLDTLDVWIDARTGDVDHVDISIKEAGKPPHRMYIRNIRSGVEIDRSLFDLSPPAGYTTVVLPDGTARASKAGAAQSSPKLRVEIRQANALKAVVMPMKGSYLQIRSALEKVETYLKTAGVTPVGPPFARYLEAGQEPSWEAGFPVARDLSVPAPFQMLSLPREQIASATAKGSWEAISGTRWIAFLKSVEEQGFRWDQGRPAMEFWFGEDGRPETQFTEMRIPVVKAEK